tara:strand:- start:21374 stop:22111 length:738 start_codon:yes stop_codon:yes gene_type:complete
MFKVFIQSAPEKQQQLQSQWGLIHDEQADIILSFVQDKLQVTHKQHAQVNPIYVDFLTGKAAYRRKFGGGKNQTLIKAIGLKSNKTWRVLDATAGLGRDAFVFASFGCDVVLFERHPVIAALLDDGLRRAYADPEIGTWMQSRMQLFYGSSLTELEQYTQPIDVVYLDPMYPHKEKSALVKKEMRLFQTIVGSDNDADALLQPALNLARSRVVVKRPQTAEYLAHRSPTLTFDMKKNRFDVYLKT